MKFCRMQFHCIKMSQCFPKPYKTFGGDINVKVDLPNYATKSDLKNATGIDTFKLAAKSDLVSLKDEVDKLDIDKLKSVLTNLSNLKSKVDKLDTVKLETTPVDLSKISNVVKNDKIPDITNVATKTILIAKTKKLRLKYQVLVV